MNRNVFRFLVLIGAFIAFEVYANQAARPRTPAQPVARAATRTAAPAPRAAAPAPRAVTPAPAARPPAPQPQRASTASVASYSSIQNRWYAGARFMQNFMFFKEKHDAAAGYNCVLVIGENTYNVCDTVTHTAIPQMGFDFFVGYKIDNNWHAGLEVGYLTEHRKVDCDLGICFNLFMAAPYLSLNATYNTDEKPWGWVYGGLGVGMAMPNPRVEGFEESNADNSKLSVMPSVIMGYRVRMADKWFFDAGYKFSMYDAGSLTYKYGQIPGTDITLILKNDLGWIMNHAIRLGIAFEF